MSHGARFEIINAHIRVSRVGPSFRVSFSPELVCPSVTRFGASAARQYHVGGVTDLVPISCSSVRPTANLVDKRRPLLVQEKDKY